MRMGEVSTAIVRILAFYGAELAILFGAAGRWDLPMFWACLAVQVVPSLVLIPILHRHSPGLMEERMRPGAGNQDRIGIPVQVICTLAALLVAGLDAGRFHWSGRFPFALQVAGLVGFAAGYAFVGWSMWANRFFSSVVRIQADREQTVVSTGPYRFVRHPGYTGGIVFSLCTGLALGSWWSLVPMAVVVANVIRRTALEDAMLHRELGGYAEYARTVRFRLVPGLW